jgi:UDP-4-amino-4,6-dideoxy-L-N-acetyl-beta-L-altrosamine transaminase
MKNIPYGRQHIDSSDIKAVSKALKADLITTGDYVNQFEKKITKLLKVKFAVSCNSGTSAIHLAFLSINLSKNDVIIMPAINFIAAYNLAKIMGAKVFLADVDPSTGQMTPEKLLECIKKNKLKKIKAIVTMYLGGYPENVIEFYKIKKKLGFFLIEDACHALGAQYNFKGKNIYIGSCKHSDISTFSLHPVKTITSAEGGVATTNNKQIFSKMRLFRSHGIKKKKFHWDYEILFNGFNYRLSDINCALAISQIKKIKKFINLRKRIYFFYKKKFYNFSSFFTLPKYRNNIKSSYHLFIINFNLKKILVTKKNFLIKMLKNKIICQYHYKPIFLFGKIFNEKFMKKDFKGAMSYYKNTISLPIFPDLSKKNQIFIIKIIKNLLQNTSNRAIKVYNHRNYERHSQE